MINYNLIIHVYKNDYKICKSLNNNKKKSKNNQKVILEAFGNRKMIN